MSASLLSRLETAETSCDRIILLDELRATTAELPDRTAPFMHLIQGAFTDFLRPVRSLAYQCALNYISSNPSVRPFSFILLDHCLIGLKISFMKTLFYNFTVAF